VVPFGTGELSLRRENSASSHAIVTEHLFGGGAATIHVPLRDGQLKLNLREHSDNGAPIEWIEVTMA
jgi:hypothetical protein